MFASDSAAFRRISFARVDGAGIRTLDIDKPVETPVYRPPDGAEIAFGSGSTYSSGIYVINADGSNLRTLVEPAANIWQGNPIYSPDGSLIAYDNVRFGVTDWTQRTHVMSADGTGDRTLPLPADVLWAGEAVFSNDGASLAQLRGYSPQSADDSVLAVVPTDGSGTGVQTDRGLLTAWPSRFEWAPDDSTILLTPMDRSGQAGQQLLVDPSTGQARPAPWSATSDPSWQRLAP
jgi:Tol biopolymer transport system component